MEMPTETMITITTTVTQSPRPRHRQHNHHHRHHRHVHAHGRQNLFCIQPSKVQIKPWELYTIFSIVRRSRNTGMLQEFITIFAVKGLSLFNSLFSFPFSITSIFDIRHYPRQTPTYNLILSYHTYNSNSNLSPSLYIIRPHKTRLQ